MSADNVQVMLGRRPAKAQQDAFGHVDLSADARTSLSGIVHTVVEDAQRREEVPFHPDDEAEPTEVLVADLEKFDDLFQPQAAWSLERAIDEIRDGGLPETLDAGQIRDGGWSFYVVRARLGKSDAVIVRSKSPTYGLDSRGKFVTALVGAKLRPVSDPLIAFDYSADILVVDKKVFVLNPPAAERLLVDANAVKARAPKAAASFKAQLGAPVDGPTMDWVERVCSHNAIIGRRVERLIRDGGLANVTAAGVRAALPNAGLSKTAFGKSGSLRVRTDDQAKVLIDICADLYYQPRFDSSPRRVAAYRKL